MRICILCRILWTSGVPKMAVHQAHQLERMGHEVEIVFLRGSHLTGYRDLLSGVTYRVISETGDSLLSPAYEWITGLFAPDRGAESRVDYNLIRHFPSEISQDRFDYIICHDQFAGLAGYFSKKRLGVPYSVYMNERVRKFQVPFMGRFADWFEGQVLKNAIGVFLITPKIGESIFRKHGVAGIVNYLGMDRISAAPYGEKDHSLIAVSMWDLGRRPWGYLPVLELLPEFKFRIVGRWRVPGAKKIFVEECEKRGLRSRVDIVEGVPEVMLDSLYEKSKFYLRFGYGEYGSGSSVECLQHCVPLIMNEDIGTSDLVREFGCGGVFDSANPAGIANWIREHDNAVAYQELQDGISRLSHLYSWQAHCEKLLQPLRHD